MFLIISFVIITCLTFNHQIIINTRILEKKIDSLEKNKELNIKECDYKCLIKKALLPLK